MRSRSRTGATPCADVAPPPAEPPLRVLNDGGRLLRKETVRHLLDSLQGSDRYAGGWSLVGPDGDAGSTLAHNGSNTFWFAMALVERSRGAAYAAMANVGGDVGEASATAMLRRLRRRRHKT